MAKLGVLCIVTFVGRYLDGGPMKAELIVVSSGPVDTREERYRSGRLEGVCV